MNRMVYWRKWQFKILVLFSDWDNCTDDNCHRIQLIRHDSSGICPYGNDRSAISQRSTKLAARTHHTALLGPENCPCDQLIPKEGNPKESHDKPQPCLPSVRLELLASQIMVQSEFLTLDDNHRYILITHFSKEQIKRNYLQPEPQPKQPNRLP